MKLFDNMKEFFFPSDDVPEQVPVRQSQDIPPVTNIEAQMAAGREPGSNIVSIQATAQLQVVLVKPEVFTDAKAIADHLISRKTVVLNLETASPENRRRIIDFLVGVSYAISGSLKPVANLTYIITPYNVGFIGDDLAAELENNGVII
ncbi:MAG: cell division protein SepF [Oscillospiraceae bacterium]|nr:cell division protein SepF [Oscillospiraceae bacterium]